MNHRHGSPPPATGSPTRSSPTTSLRRSSSAPPASSRHLTDRRGLSTASGHHRSLSTGHFSHHPQTHVAPPTGAPEQPEEQGWMINIKVYLWIVVFLCPMGIACFIGDQDGPWMTIGRMLTIFDFFTLISIYFMILSRYQCNRRVARVINYLYLLVVLCQTAGFCAVVFQKLNVPFRFYAWFSFLVGFLFVWGILSLPWSLPHQPADAVDIP